MPDGNNEAEAPREEDMARLHRAHALFLPQLLTIPGVHTVGIGYKRVGGEVTDVLAVIVFVDEKLPRAEVEPHRLIPPQLRFYWESSEQEEVVPTDVVERPRAVEYPHVADGALATRVRPVPGGRSIQGPSGGTIGGWVWDNVDEQVVLLSNNHVLGGTAGTDVFQPWGSTAAADLIADVVRTGTLDATIAAPINLNDVAYEIEGIGAAVYEVGAATLNMQVEKSGATTEHTTGRVVTVGLTGHYGSTNDFEVDRDVGIDRFAYYGDSGSLIVERTHPTGANWKRVVGLLWGGVPSLRNAYAHQIQDVFADLNLTTVCGGLVEEILDGLFASSFAALPERTPAVELVPAVRPWTPPIPWRVFLERAERPRPRHRGFARDIEGSLGASERGREIVDAVHRNRVSLVQILSDREVRRALEAAVMPFVAGAWTADEVLERTVSSEDAERFRRLAAVVSKKRPDLADVLATAEELTVAAEGHRLADLL